MPRMLVVHVLRGMSGTWHRRSAHPNAVNHGLFFINNHRFNVAPQDNRDHRLSATDKVDCELADVVAEPQEAPVAPGSLSSLLHSSCLCHCHPHPHTLPCCMGAKTLERLNHSMLSSMASGTTLTTGSTPSFVEDMGLVYIRCIAPEG